MEDVKKIEVRQLFKLIFFSTVGIIMFFVPINMFGKTTIPLDHIVTLLKTNTPNLSKIYIFIALVIGVVKPLIKKSYKENISTFVFFILKIIGLIFAMMYVLNIGPRILMQDEIIPYVYNSVVIQVGLVVPVGAVFLSFLINYGLLEFIGVLMEPFMKPIFKTPGKSAVDAVASFVGSYSLALLITNRIYKEGKYNTKEAFIIATGFSTVSASFMIVVAKGLDLIYMWNFYFWTTMLITFVTTAIVVRLRPTTDVSTLYYSGIKNSEIESINQYTGFKYAILEGIDAVKKAPTIIKGVKSNVIDGFMMASNILPNILSIGVIGLIVAKYTVIFDVIAYILYPITYVLSFIGLQDPLFVAKAGMVTIVDMFVPVTITHPGLNLLTRYVIGVVSISSILFLSASIPCILATAIPIKFKDLIIIWFERVLISIILATLFGIVFLV